VSIVGGRGKDLRVVVTKDDGTVVADNVTIDELQTKDPEAYALVKSAVASSHGTYVDAILSPVELRSEHVPRRPASP
jgi:hypothetical protein